MVATSGFEPETSRLSVERSKPIELSGRKKKVVYIDVRIAAMLSYIAGDAERKPRFSFGTRWSRQESDPPPWIWGDVRESNPHPPSSQLGALTY